MPSACIATAPAQSAPVVQQGASPAPSRLEIVRYRHTRDSLRTSLTRKASSRLIPHRLTIDISRDQHISGLVANVGDPAGRVLRLTLQPADGTEQLADFLAQLEALRGQVLLVQPSLGFHLGDVILYSGEGGTRAQWLHRRSPRGLGRPGRG